jgi:hypothetical protein
LKIPKEAIEQLAEAVGFRAVKDPGESKYKLVSLTKKGNPRKKQVFEGMLFRPNRAFMHLAYVGRSLNLLYSEMAAAIDWTPPLADESTYQGDDSDGSADALIGRIWPDRLLEDPNG